jgi:uncharacterized membrane protein
MENTPGHSRIFKEKEVSEVLKRAVRLQEREGAGDAAGTGLTLAELKQIAAEVGIDPQYVQAALTQLEGDDEEEKTFSLMGGPFKIEMERTVTGEITASEWEHVVQEIRHTLGEVGKPGQLGSAYEWINNNQQQGYASAITLSPKGGRTHIRVFQNNWIVPFLSYFLPLILLGIIGGALMIESAIGWIGLPVWASILATVFFVIRFIMLQWGKVQRRKVKRLFDRIEAILSEQEAPVAVASGETAAVAPSRRRQAAKPQIELPEPSEEEASAPRSSRRSSTRQG